MEISAKFPITTVKFVSSIGFTAMADRIEWPPSLSRDRKQTHWRVRLEGMIVEYRYTDECCVTVRFCVCFLRLVTTRVSFELYSSVVRLVAQYVACLERLVSLTVLFIVSKKIVLSQFCHHRPKKTSSFV